MLHLNRPLTVVGGGKSFTSEMTSPTELLSSFTRFFSRQFPTILLVALLSIGIGVVYVLIKQPVYTAQALMIIDTHKLKTFQKQEVPSENVIDSGMVDSEVEILRSENITLAVINRFHLTTDPEFIGRGGGFVGALPHWMLRLVGLDAPKTQ